jgi:hypothetical protein
VARKLNRRGNRTRRGKEFKARLISAIAENPDYVGSTAYPRIIDRDLWRQVNEKIERPAFIRRLPKLGRSVFDLGTSPPEEDALDARVPHLGDCGSDAMSSGGWRDAW